MPPAKSTTSMAKEHEKYVEDLYAWDSAKRSRSSGASFHDPADVTSDGLVIECEATEAKSYRLTLDYWNEVRTKAHSGKKPVLAIRLRDPQNGRHVDLIVSDMNDDTEMRETLEAYRLEAIG